jgi:hypothetical protein
MQPAGLPYPLPFLNDPSHYGDAQRIRDKIRAAIAALVIVEGRVGILDESDINEHHPVTPRLTTGPEDTRSIHRGVCQELAQLANEHAHLLHEYPHSTLVFDHIAITSDPTTQRAIDLAVLTLERNPDITPALARTNDARICCILDANYSAAFALAYFDFHQQVHSRFNLCYNQRRVLGHVPPGSGTHHPGIEETLEIPDEDFP